MSASCIEARGLTRRFGATVAVQPFDVDVGPGEITGPCSVHQSAFLLAIYASWAA